MAEIIVEDLDLEEDTLKDKYLIFSLGQEDYGLEIKYVREIIRIQPIAQVPELPGYIKGVINLRGKIIPIMDVRLRFKKEAREYDDRTCIIVVDIKDIGLGLVVDRVVEVLSIPQEEISPPPQVDKGSQRKYIQGIGKIDNQVKILLDSDKLLDEEEKEYLEDAL